MTIYGVDLSKADIALIIIAAILAALFGWALWSAWTI